MVLYILLHGGDAGFDWHLPPLHPILVNFTAALIPVSVLSDILGVVLGRQSLRAAGWWTLLFGAVITPFTVLAGWMWLQASPGMAHAEMTVHQWLGSGLAAGILLLALWRGRAHRLGKPPGVPYLLAGTVVVGALVFQGFLGGSMSFGGHGSPPPVDHPTTSPARTGPDADRHADGRGGENGDDRKASGNGPHDHKH